MVSVIVPVYNTKEFLSRCVASILAQEHCKEPLEILLIDDGSTDGSAPLCDNLTHEHPDVVRVIHQENGGPSKARNTGLDAARGEWVLFVDSDDTICSNTIASVLARQKETNAKLVVYSYNNITNGIVSPVSFGDRLYTTKAEIGRDFSQLHVQFFFNSIWNKLYARELLTCRFPLDKTLGEDFIFNMEYLKSCDTIAAMSDCFYQYYHDTTTALTAQYRENKFELAIDLARHAHTSAKDWLQEAYDPRGINSILIGDTMRTIQRYVCSSTDSLCTKHKTICTWMRHEDVRKATKNMYTKPLVFKCLKVVFTLQLVTIPLFAFQLQKRMQHQHTVVAAKK